MNEQIRMTFLQEMKPIIFELASHWFPADKKTPDGKYYYACTYCDMECGGHVRHDPDCLYQMAKNTVEKWEEIDKDDRWDLDWKGRPRDPKEIEDFREIFKYWAIFRNFLINVDQFVPMDFSDPRNESVICSCMAFHKTTKYEKHSPKCPYLRVSKALHKLLKPTGRRLAKT